MVKIYLLEQFPCLPGDAGIPIDLWCAISGRSRSSTYRDMKSGIIESFTIGKSRRIRVASARRALTGGACK
jgi:hypothetical protein